MGEFLYIHNHVEELLGLLLSQFARAAALRAMVELLGEHAQCLEDLAWVVNTQTVNLEEATGASLDLWGSILGARRETLGDEAYRGVLQAVLLVNRAGGTVPEFLEIIRRLLRSPVSSYRQHPEASFSLWASGHMWPATGAQRRRATRLLRKIIPAGVRVEAIIDAPLGHFGFADDPEASGWDGIWSEEIYYDTP